MDDKVDNVINKYLSSKDVSTSGKVDWDIDNAPKEKEVALLGIKFISNVGDVKATFQIDEGFEIHINFMIIESVKNLRTILRFKTTLGETVFATYEDSQIQQGFTRQPGIYTAICKIPPNVLNNITYRIYVGFDSPGYKVLLQGRNYLEVDIIDTSDGYRYARGAFDGPIRPVVDWNVEEALG
jgi:hypothetical protein